MFLTKENYDVSHLFFDLDVMWDDTPLEKKCFLSLQASPAIQGLDLNEEFAKQ